MKPFSVKKKYSESQCICMSTYMEVEGRPTFVHWKALYMVGSGRSYELPLHHSYTYSKVIGNGSISAMTVMICMACSWLYSIEKNFTQMTLRLVSNDPGFPWCHAVNWHLVHGGCAFKSYSLPVSFHNSSNISKLVAASEQHHSYYFTGCTSCFAVHPMKSVIEIVRIWTKQ